MINQDISAEKLLNQFQSEHTNVFDILHNKEGLLGILLGFGRHNAMLFQEREDLERVQKFGIYKQENIQKKLDRVNGKLKFFHEHDIHIISSINRVMFLADPSHPETVQ